MTRIVYTDAAERDLTQIALTIAADNPNAARRFIAEIRKHCLLLTTVPFMGRPRPDIGPNIRSFPHGSHMVYYCRWDDPDRVDILRIWHGRRQTPTIADLL